MTTETRLEQQTLNLGEHEGESKETLPQRLAVSLSPEQLNKYPHLTSVAEVVDEVCEDEDIQYRWNVFVSFLFTHGSNPYNKNGSIRAGYDELCDVFRVRLEAARGMLDPMYGDGTIGYALNQVAKRFEQPKK